jgi:hypothetical protein
MLSTVDQNGAAQRFFAARGGRRTMIDVRLEIA